MRDDRELLYMAGEMSDAERAEYEASLSAEQRRQAETLRAAFADLRAAKDDIPAPQISFDRVRQAIETAGTAPAARVWPWQRWFWIAVPTAAAVFVLAAMWPRGEVLPVPTASGSEVVAAAPAPAPTLGETMESAAPAVAAESNRVTVADVSETPAPVRSSEPAPRPRVRRPARRLVADLGPRLQRSSEGLMKASAGTMAAPMAAPMDAVPVQEVGTGAAAARGGPGSTELGSSERAEDTVVVVTRTEDAATGANAAMEVRRDDDVVLGG